MVTSLKVIRIPPVVKSKKAAGKLPTAALAAQRPAVDSLYSTFRQITTNEPFSNKI
jgi:hypothetical protein